MLLFNIVVILILLGYVGMGMKDGFVHTLGRIVGAIVGFIAARMWSPWVGSILAAFMPSGWAHFIAFIVIYFVIARAVGFVFKLLDGAFKLISIIPFLKSINNLLGGFLGFFEGIFMLGGSFWILLTYPLVPSLATLINQSAVAMWIEKMFHYALVFML